MQKAQQILEELIGLNRWFYWKGLVSAARAITYQVFTIFENFFGDPASEQNFVAAVEYSNEVTTI